MNKTEIFTRMRSLHTSAYSIGVGLYVECSQRYFYYGWKGAAAGAGIFVVSKFQESKEPDSIPQPSEAPQYAGQVLLEHGLDSRFMDEAPKEVVSAAA